MGSRPSEVGQLGRPKTSFLPDDTRAGNSVTPACQAARANSGPALVAERGPVSGRPCQGSAMLNGRCQMHGGRSTGP